MSSKGKGLRGCGHIFAGLKYNKSHFGGPFFKSGSILGVLRLYFGGCLTKELIVPSAWCSRNYSCRHDGRTDACATCRMMLAAASVLPAGRPMRDEASQHFKLSPKGSKIRLGRTRLFREKILTFLFVRTRRFGRLLTRLRQRPRVVLAKSTRGVC